MDMDVRTLDRWLAATFKAELSTVTGINPIVDSANAEQRELTIAACRSLKLLGADGNPVPEALVVIKKYLPDFPDSGK